MLICVGGDIHGALDRFYADVLAFEQSLGSRRFACVLHVGDFGIWPDAERVDRATANHEGAGDFPAWVREKRTAPRTTFFIKGNHEDFEWLDKTAHHQSGNVIGSNLNHLRNGRVLNVGTDREPLRVAGLGGCYGPSDYERASKSLAGSARRHYTRDECEKLTEASGVDVLLLHDAPAGVRFETHGRRGSYVSEAAGLAELVWRVHPKLCFFGHHHRRVEATFAGVRCIGLNKVGCPGNLVAVDTGDWTVVAEWPIKD